ncbi:MAG: prepilin-type cleavage/methylation domain-containing protein [Gammaproteobacteria bacterium]|nr:prepilin-type cleavage/methylation domain-containing protein [Gammaproteobacteria bacterium]MBU1623527.1 prepilin-type cleavage/methylation domain-containing protein [Gammaproteobacteria bacterium]
MRISPPSKISGQQGVVIIEAMIAILIFSVGVLGIVGMQANMIKNTSDSKFRNDASYIAQQQIGTLWTSPDNLPADNSTSTSPVNELPNGTVTITRNADQYTIVVGWKQPGENETTHSYTTVATITGI